MDTHEELLTKWSQEPHHQGHCFIKDGIVDFTRWKSASPRVLFLLKEARHDGPESSWDLREFIRQSGPKGPAFWNSAYWCYAIHHIALGQVRPFPTEKQAKDEAAELFRSRAVVNTYFVGAAEEEIAWRISSLLTEQESSNRAGRAVMENLGRIIVEHPFCNGLQPDSVELLISCASNVRFEADQHLFREGGEANHFYLIREGKVALEVAAERPRRIMETAAEGEVLGWSWLVAPYRWHFDARAVGPVRAIAIDGKCLRAKCQKHHDLGYELLRRTVDMVGQRLEAEHFRLLDLYSAEGPLEPKVTSDRDF